MKYWVVNSNIRKVCSKINENWQHLWILWLVIVSFPMEFIAAHIFMGTLMKLYCTSQWNISWNASQHDWEVAWIHTTCAPPAGPASREVPRLGAEAPVLPPTLQRGWHSLSPDKQNHTLHLFLLSRCSRSTGHLPAPSLGLTINLSWSSVWDKRIGVGFRLHISLFPKRESYLRIYESLYLSHTSK